MIGAAHGDVQILNWSQGSGPLRGSWEHPGLWHRPRCPTGSPRRGTHPHCPGDAHGQGRAAGPRSPPGLGSTRGESQQGWGRVGRELSHGSRLAAPPSAAFSSSENCDASVVWLHLGAAPRGPSSVYTQPPAGPQPMPSPPEQHTPRHGGKDRRWGCWGEGGGTFIAALGGFGHH